MPNLLSGICCLLQMIRCGAPYRWRLRPLAIFIGSLLKSDEFDSIDCGGSPRNHALVCTISGYWFQPVNTFYQHVSAGNVVEISVPTERLSRQRKQSFQRVSRCIRFDDNRTAVNKGFMPALLISLLETMPVRREACPAWH